MWTNQQLRKRIYDSSVQAVSSYQSQMQDLRSDYTASKQQRFLNRPQGIHSAGSSADYHLRNSHDYYYMLEFARHIVRNDQIVGQGVRTFVRNIIQEGFCLRPNTGDEALDDELKDRWDTWATRDQSVDVGMEYDFHAMERCCAASIITDGDICFNPLTTGQLQPFEAHRLRSPDENRATTQNGARRRDIVLGVEKLRSGARSRYWITKQDYDGINLRRSNFGMNDVQPYDAFVADQITGEMERNFFHVFSSMRYSLTRGVSPLVPVLVTSGMHDDVQYAKLIQQQLVSYFALIHNIDSDSDAELETPDSGEGGTVETNTNCPSGEKILQASVHHPGAEYWGQKGETLEGFSPNVPNAEFFEQSRMLLTFISVNLDMPLMLFLMDAGETNFSGWRGSMDQAKIRFKDFQRELADRFHARVYRWKLRQWLVQDADLRRRFNNLGPAMFKHTWHYPRWPYIEPLSDTQADHLEMQTAQNSPRRIAMRKNLEWKTIVDESVEDRGYAIETAAKRAEAINANLPQEDRISWRELISFELPQGFQMSLPRQEQQPSGQSTGTKPAGSGSKGGPRQRAGR